MKRLPATSPINNEWIDFAEEQILEDLEDARALDSQLNYHTGIVTVLFGALFVFQQSVKDYTGFPKVLISLTLAVNAILLFIASYYILKTIMKSRLLQIDPVANQLRVYEKFDRFLQKIRSYEATYNTELEEYKGVDTEKLFTEWYEITVLKVNRQNRYTNELRYEYLQRAVQFWSFSLTLTFVLLLYVVLSPVFGG